MTHGSLAESVPWWAPEPGAAPSPLPPARRLSRAIRTLALLAGYVVLSAVVMLHASDWSVRGGLKWDGLRYDGLVSEYVDGGLSAGAVRGIGPGGLPLGSAYVNRIGYFATIGGLEVLTGVPRVMIYRFVSIVAFALAALGVAALARHAGADSVSAGFAGAWLLLNPAAYIVFEIGAHPEPLALALAAGALCAHASRRHYLAASLLAVGTLMKVGVAFLGPYVAIGLIADPAIRRGRALPLAAVTLAAVAAGVLTPYAIVPSAGELDHIAVWNVLLSSMQTRAFASLLYNFDVLWLVWGAALLHTSRAERLQIAAVCGLLILALFWIAIDWWRVPYGVLAVLVLPASAAFLSGRFNRTVGATGTWCILVAVTALLLRLPARFDWAAIDQYSLWPLAAVGVILALNEGWLLASSSTDRALHSA